MRRQAGKLAAAALGVGLCALSLTAWRLPAEGSAPGLDLRLIAVPPGELTIERSGVVAAARGMQAGEGPVEATIELTNIAGRDLRVRLVPLGSQKGLADKLRFRTAEAEIPADASRRLRISAWLPEAAAGYRGRILDVTVEPRSVPLGGQE